MADENGSKRPENVEDHGFTIETFPTKTGGFRYEAEVPQAE